MAERMSITEMLRRRRLAIEQGDPTGGEHLDQANPRGRYHAESVREQLGIKKRKKGSGSR